MCPGSLQPNVATPIAASSQLRRHGCYVESVSHLQNKEHASCCLIEDYHGQIICGHIENSS